MKHRGPEAILASKAINRNSQPIDYTDFKERLAKSSLVLNVKFLSIKDNPILLVFECQNPYIFALKDGTFIIAPAQQIFSNQSIKNFLGMKYSRVTHWGLLPSKTSPQHPFKQAAKTRGIHDALL